MTRCCIICCMAATRTQIYLSEEQREALDEAAEAEGVTMAELVRRALTAYLADTTPNPEPALTATFGAAPDAAAPSRGEWNCD